MSTLMRRVENAQQLWTAVFPNCPAPPPRQFVLWTSRFTDKQLERAIMRGSRRFTGNVIPEDVHRYTTGLLLNLEREQATTATTTTAAGTLDQNT